MCPMIMPFFRIATAKYCRSHIEAVALLRCRETTWLCKHGDCKLCSQSWKMLPLLVTSWGKSVQLDWDLAYSRDKLNMQETPISTLPQSSIQNRVAYFWGLTIYLYYPIFTKRSPYSREYKHPGPHSPRKMETQGPYFIPIFTRQQHAYASCETHS